MKGLWKTSKQNKGKGSKPWFKPPSWFKKLKRQSQRHKEKQALRTEKEIPEFKKTNIWDWN